MYKKRVAFNSIAAFLDYTTKVAVTVLLAPEIIAALGASMFGVWQILLKLGDQVLPADGRASVFLKWKLANNQNSTVNEKAGILNNVFFSWLFFVPIYFMVCLLVYVNIPDLIKINNHQEVLVAKEAWLFLALGVALLSVKSIASGVLYGMNLAYKGMGVIAVTNIGGGLLMYLALKYGYELQGIAVAHAFSQFLALIVIVYIVNRNIDWIKINSPDIRAVFQTIKASMWFIAWGFVEIGIIAIDVILIGFFVSTDVVSQYYLTGYPSQFVTVVVLLVVTAALPSLASVVTGGNPEHGYKLNHEATLYSLLLGLSVGAALILFNVDIVSLWVGREQYAGDVENFLIIIAVLQLMMVRSSAAVINLAVDIRKKVIMGVASLSVTAILALILVAEYSIIGMCVSMIIGRSVMTYYYPKLVSEYFGVEMYSVRVFARLLVSGMILFIVSYVLGMVVSVDSWLELVFIVPVTILLNMAFIYLAGMSVLQKSIIVERLASLRRTCSI